ncbi:MAG: LytR/AlgR family response regulator transcription factor [Bacteroidia bacterium]
MLPPSKICISTQTQTHFINASQILFVAGENNYSLVHFMKDETRPEKILCSKGLVYYEKLLDHRTFFRIHNRFIVNLVYIDYYDKNNHNAILKSGISIPVSYRKKKEFLSKMNLILPD